MDVSLADLSMRDVEGIEKPSTQTVPKIHKVTATTTKTRSTKRAAPTAKRRATVRPSKS